MSSREGAASAADGAETQSEGFGCPRCGTRLPEQRRSFPWCDCGWSLPDKFTDPLDRLWGWRRRWGEATRRVGDRNIERDVAWLRSRNWERRPDWLLMNGLFFLAAVLGALVHHSLALVAGGMVGAGVWLWEGNPGLAFLLVVLALPLSPALIRRYWRRTGRRGRSDRRAKREAQVQRRLEHQKILEAAQDVAERLGVSAPVRISLTARPLLRVRGFVDWSFPPRPGRALWVGLPLLGTLSMGEFKALVGGLLISHNGIQLWMRPAVDRLLGRAARLALDRLGDRVLRAADRLRPYGLEGFFLLILLVGLALVINWQAVGVIVLLPLSALVLVNGLLWGLAAWNRRQTLRADRLVARSFGRNVLLGGLSKAAAIAFYFDRQARWAAVRGDKRLFYTQFREGWEAMPQAIKERVYGAVTTEYHSLFYFRPLYEDRVRLLADLPQRLADDRPALDLLPFAAELESMMSEDLFGLK